MNRLIVNADDFGLTEGVSLGIIEAIRFGSVTSTSVMVCSSIGRALLIRHRLDLRGRAGVHLQLTDGTPCSPPGAVSSLIGPDGRFPRSRRQLRKPRPDEILREWEAQLTVAKDLGLTPVHLDTHHHVHANPRVFDVFLEVARRHRVPARPLGSSMVRNLRQHGLTCVDYCETGWYRTYLTADGLLRLLNRSFKMCGGSEGIVELVCHPGRPSDELRRRSNYADERAKEAAVLTSKNFREGLFRAGIQLSGWSFSSAAQMGCGSPKLP